MRALPFVLLLGLFSTPATAVTLGPTEGFLFCPAPPALERHPAVGDRVIAACDVVAGASPIVIDPMSAMSFPGPDYFVPGSLDCTHSGGATPSVGGLWIESAARAWLTTSGCELALPYALDTGGDVSLLFNGASRRSVPAEVVLSGSFTTYRDGLPGSAVTSFATSFTSGSVVAGGRLLVASSNFATTGSNPELYPGTVLLFDIDDSGPTPVVTTASPPFIVTSDPNPTGLAVLPSGLVAVTNTGLLDPSLPPFVTDLGSIDIIDPGAGALLGSLPLGTNPGGALAVDATGSVGVVGSHTARVLFAVDLRGLGGLPDPEVAPGVQRPSCHDTVADQAGGLPCLRARVIHGAAGPLALPPPPGGSGTAGFVPQVRFGDSGDFLAATSFNDGGLALVAFDPRNLSWPHPLLPSRFGAPETLVAVQPPGFGSECCPGPLVLHESSAGGVAGTTVAWLTGFPSGVLVRATLAGTLAAPAGDFDADTVQDAVDNCPLTANGGQLDSGSVGAGPSDDIGDACQCGDVAGSGVVDLADLAELRAFLLDPGSAVLSFPEKCDVSGDGVCDVAEVARITRALAQAGPALEQGCGAAAL